MPQAVRIDGLADLRRDLKAIDAKLPRELNKTQREALKPIATRAAALAPKQSGVLAASIKPFATARSAGLRSRQPYSKVQHWGSGKVTASNPKGILGTRFIYSAMESQMDKLVQDIADGFEDLARRHGFR